MDLSQPVIQDKTPTTYRGADAVPVEPDRSPNLIDDSLIAAGTIGSLERFVSLLEHAIDPELRNNEVELAGMTGTSRPALCYAFNGINHRLNLLAERLHALTIRVGTDG